MEYVQLKDDIKNGARPIYLLEGNDAYFRMHAEQQIKAAFSELPELNFTAYDGADIKGSAYTAFTAAIQAFPFMAEKRIIKVTEFYPTDGEYDRYLKPLFDDFPSTTILIIVNSQGKTGVDLKRKKAVTYVNCNKADEDTVTRWAYITFKRAGITSSAEACGAIAAYCLSDMSRVAKEVEKLTEWAKDSKTVTRADVDELVYKDADYRIYEMTNCVARRDYASFAEISQDLLSKGFDENALIASLASYFKNLLYISLCGDRDADIASALRMTEWGVKKSREQARAMGRDRLAKLFKGAYALASALKSGEMTPSGAFEAATAKVFFS